MFHVPLTPLLVFEILAALLSEIIMIIITQPVESILGHRPPLNVSALFYFVHFDPLGCLPFEIVWPSCKWCTPTSLIRCWFAFQYCFSPSSVFPPSYRIGPVPFQISIRSVMSYTRVFGVFLTLCLNKPEHWLLHFSLSDPQLILWYFG